MPRQDCGIDQIERLGVRQLDIVGPQKRTRVRWTSPSGSPDLSAPCRATEIPIPAADTPTGTRSSSCRRCHREITTTTMPIDTN
ncbi:MAG TPA: hypothetical protein VLB73_00055 [Patescibacteria group bacterium]|nr:hypothetical protein [Patescibacteria group bacterium]